MLPKISSPLLKIWEASASSRDGRELAMISIASALSITPYRSETIARMISLPSSSWRVRTRKLRASLPLPFHSVSRRSSSPLTNLTISSLYSRSLRKLSIVDGMSVNIRNEFKPDSLRGVPSIRVLASKRRISDSFLVMSFLFGASPLTTLTKSASGVHLSCQILETWR